MYRATDTNLKRQVAIKVLPASVAGDADRLARFQREAEVLAALNRPNIAAIYGLEKTPITVTGSAIVPGAPVALFQTRIAGGGGDVQQGRQYDVAPDGRFLINAEALESGVTPITVIQNWNPDAKK